MSKFKVDGFVKSSTVALRFIFHHCGVLVSTPHSSRFASLAFGAFYFAVPFLTFYKFIKGGNPWKTGKTKSERKGIWPTNRDALKRRDNGVAQKLRSYKFFSLKMDRNYPM
jgi:hypothetical protein